MIDGALHVADAPLVSHQLVVFRLNNWRNFRVARRQAARARGASNAERL
jgi:hypothetical protein